MFVCHSGSGSTCTRPVSPANDTQRQIQTYMQIYVYTNINISGTYWHTYVFSIPSDISAPLFSSCLTDDASTCKWKPDTTRNSSFHCFRIAASECWQLSVRSPLCLPWLLWTPIYYAIVMVFVRGMYKLAVACVRIDPPTHAADQTNS